jgi:hypothetical protein
MNVILVLDRIKSRSLVGSLKGTIVSLITFKKGLGETRSLRRDPTIFENRVDNNGLGV